jgi:nitrilase
MNTQPRRRFWISLVLFDCLAISCGPGSLAGAAETSASNEQGSKGHVVRIAVVQQESVPGQVDLNRQKALRFAQEALDNHADIVLFHEALLVGYVPEIHDLAEPADGETTESFRTLLAGTTSIILYGLIERDGDDYFTSAVAVDANGVVANYRKTHLWWNASGVRHEPSFFQAGKELVTFKLNGHKCGVMICYDGDFPEMTRAYANMDCEMLFWLNNRRSRGPNEVIAKARNNSMIIATSCSCGHDESGFNCEGGSNIVDEGGNVLADIWKKEGIIYADVDPSNIREARSNNPWIRGQRQDLYRTSVK